MGMNAPVSVALALFGLAAGVGITAVGPGGVLATIGLFLLTGLSPAAVAGTGIATHVATGVMAVAAYTRSGQLRDSATRRVAAILAVAAVVGTPLGVLFNALVGGEVFGILLAVAVAVTGLLVWVREYRAPVGGDAHSHVSTTATGAVGSTVAVASGLFGLGGPMLAVPLLVICGLPVLPSLAAAQVQSVVIAGIGTFGYLMQGAVDWPLALLVGIPELAGVLLGWKIAHVVPTRRLKYALAAALLVLAPYLAFHA